MENDPKPILLEVSKEGNHFVGDLVWDDGSRWKGWQKFKRLRELVSNARCTFKGPIVRI